MPNEEFINRSIRYDPELDLDEVPELPGKDVMEDVRRRFREESRCSELIQDSHGWCFYVHADDRRKYLIELCYSFTDHDGSYWMLHCDRCPGLRVWEWFRSRQSTGREQLLLDKGMQMLLSHHGFERSQA